MIHNERGLRVSGEPVKTHDVTVVIRVEGQANAEMARSYVEDAVDECLESSNILQDYRLRMIGRPNAKRATVAPED